MQQRLLSASSLRSNEFLGQAGITYQATPEALTDATLCRNEGVLSDTGALAINTGHFTGRSPKDKFISYDEVTASTVHWNEFNQPLDPSFVAGLQDKMLHFLSSRPLWVQDSYICADAPYRLTVRSICEKPSSALFAYNMFLRPEAAELMYYYPDWLLIHAPDFEADPQTDGVRSPNFSIIDFTHKLILIGGSGYTGEMKKAIFTVLNFLLPAEEKVLPMHCSANKGKNGDVALFFGLSGTGKTTLSADIDRCLIGDDEHGWTNSGIFNFEGGCYAKCIDLRIEKEPQIWKAIRPGALLENIGFYPGSNRVNFSDKAITENTRVSYPLHYIKGAVLPSIGKAPRNIFFLTCDAFGVLPPISRLTPSQSAEQFLLGYTAKIAGTEAGITMPKTTFSPCFGAPFLPLHPKAYAALLNERISGKDVHIWLINTGWTGGSYGTGERIRLAYTRAMVRAALDGSLDNAPYKSHPLFGLQMPIDCPGVPAELLDPRNTWEDKGAYDIKALQLKRLFDEKLTSFEDIAIIERIHPAPYEVKEAFV